MIIPKGWELPEFDLGHLSDYGGGRVEWWWDYIRDSLRLAHLHYQEQVDAMLAAAPTPPAQEAEPVAWIYTQQTNTSDIQSDGIWYDYTSIHRNKAFAYISTGHIPLYTHPASDELRQAAGEILQIADGNSLNNHEWSGLMENLRAALEKK